MESISSLYGRTRMDIVLYCIVCMSSEMSTVMRKGSLYIFQFLWFIYILFLFCAFEHIIRDYHICTPTNIHIDIKDDMSMVDLTYSPLPIWPWAHEHWFIKSIEVSSKTTAATWSLWLLDLWISLSLIIIVIVFKKMNHWPTKQREVPPVCSNHYNWMQTVGHMLYTLSWSMVLIVLLSLYPLFPFSIFLLRFASLFFFFS